MKIGISWLDFKLGARMLAKYPGLTLVGGLAMAFAIAVGVGGFEVMTQMVRPTLPLREGHRVVGLRNWDAAANQTEEPTLHDFAAWREELRSVRDLGAFRTTERNLITGKGGVQPIEVAEITASGFRAARVAPWLGRLFSEADEQPGVPPVTVIGHDVWRTRFASDPAVIGREIRLGNAAHTVVGVMPEGFAFPISQGLWVPLRVNALDYPPGEGPGVRVFGRLAPGISLDEAQAELTTLGRRAAADFPDTYQHLRPEVLPYARSVLELPEIGTTGLFGINLFLVMLLVLVCGNVALLMFARAVSRETEIAVRNALGASRGRIVAQLFAEALVLGGVAMVAGLAAAGFAVKLLMNVFRAEAGGRLPFWFSDTLAPTSVLYAVVLTVLAAGIAGVVPALKVTRELRGRLQRATAGGGGFRFGGLWTAVIVAQVAVTLTFPATAFFMRTEVVQIRSLDAGFPDAEYLAARLEMDRETLPGVPTDTSAAGWLARYDAAVRELERRLEADPAVASVTFTNQLPRTYHPQRRIEVEGGGTVAPASDLRHRVGSTSVALDYFDVLGTTVLSGRAFNSGDLDSEAPVVIVNRSFVEGVLGGHSPIGRRVRYAGRPDEPPSRWYEIVGVVPDLGMADGERDPDAGLYYPAAPSGAYPVHLAVHVRGDPAAFVPRLRVLTAATDPTLQLHEILPLDQAGADMWLEMDFLSRLTAGVSAVALLLSLAGIYSVMSFTVSQRTREIGIRIALGASARGVVVAIFRRPLTQVGIGIIAGAGLVVALTLAYYGSELSPKGAALITAYAALMLGVCLLACVVPTRRALRIEPTESLRADG